MTKATWIKGDSTITGSWNYNWASDRFNIFIDGADPLTGIRRPPFSVAGDTPEFSGWKLLETGPMNYPGEDSDSDIDHPGNPNNYGHD